MPPVSRSPQSQVEPRRRSIPPGLARTAIAGALPTQLLALAIVACLAAQVGCSLTPSWGGSMFWNDDKADYDESPTSELTSEASLEEPTESTADDSSLLDSLSYLDPAGLVTTKPNRPEEAKKLFAEAQALFESSIAEKKKPALAEAGKKYREAAKLWVDSALEQDALFMSGESYFFADHYAYADDAYDALIGAHPNTRHMDVVAARRFAIARYWIDLDRDAPEGFLSVNMTDQRRPWRDTFGNAVRVFDRIRIDDITGRLADDATMAAGNAYFERGDFQRADEFYSDLRMQFPASDHLFKAYFLNLKSKIESYRGVGYDATVLDEGEELLRDMMKRFPKQVQDEREYLEKAAAEIRYRKAEVEWLNGSYYERRFQYGGARYHYQTIVDQYAGTPFEERAKERLAAIAGYPDSPSETYGWVTDLLEDDPLRVPPPKNSPPAESQSDGTSESQAQP